MPSETAPSRSWQDVPATRPSQTVGVIASVFALLFFGAIGGWLASVYFPSVINGHRSRSFVQTTGSVVAIDSAGVPSKYQYTIHGIQYTSTRRSYEAFPLQMGPPTIPRKQPGDRIDVYYNSARPSESTLLTGIQPGTASFSGFALVFTYVPVMLAVGLARHLVGCPSPPVGFWQYRRENSRMLLRSSAGSPSVLAMMAGFFVAIVLGITWTTIHVVGVRAHAITPIIALFAGFWIFIPIAALAARWYVNSGRPYIVIDHLAGRLLPARRFSYRLPDAIPLTDIITLRMEQRTSQIGGESQRIRELHAEWLDRDGTPRSTILARWRYVLTDEPESLETFLRTELALPQLAAP